MRTASIATNLTCNQNCTYCTARRPAEDPAYIRQAAVKGRIDEALRSGAKEIILTGGEPTLRKDLVALIAHARGGSASSITLETNGTLVDEAAAKLWKEAGLTRARVNLSGGDDSVDAVTRDVGGFQKTLNGLRALRRAGVPTELSAAVVRSTLASLPLLPAVLHELWGDDEGGDIVLNVPVTSPDPAELVSYEAAVECILAVDKAARAVGILVRLGNETGLPPCVFPSRAPSAHLMYALSPGAAGRPGFRQLEACTSCQVADRCPGISEAYLARFPTPNMRPVQDDRTRRRLSVMSTVREQIARELVSPNRREKPGMPPEDERIIRVNFQCNQACRFCFVSTHLPAGQDRTIREAIEQAGRDGARITISGGEPALNPNLVEYVALAKQHSHGPVELQSNAIRFSDMELARSVIGAGVDEVFVSLHGSTAEISDAVTEAPGTFVKTVAGLDNLAQLNVILGLNFVMCQKNYRNLPDYIRFVHGRWPAAMLSISFVAASSDVVPRDEDLVPRYSDVLPYLREALAIAKEKGLWVSPLDSMCGIPLCLWPTSIEEQLARTDIPEGFDAGEFIKPEVCAACSVRTKCYGLRRQYVALRGSDELRPLKSLPIAAA